MTSSADPRQQAREHCLRVTPVLAGAVRVGASQVEAARQAGITQRTLSRWRKWASQGEEPFRALVQELSTARAGASAHTRVRSADMLDSGQALVLFERALSLVNAGSTWTQAGKQLGLSRSRIYLWRSWTREGTFPWASLLPMLNEVEAKVAEAHVQHKASRTKAPSLGTGWVYFIEGAGLVKIGFTSIPVYKRMTNYKTHCPVPLALLGCVSGDTHLEKALHAKYKVIRQHGEWFTLTPELREEIRTLVTHHPIVPGKRRLQREQ